MLHTTTVGIKGLRERARRSLDAQRDSAGGRSAPVPRSPEEQEVASRFADAFVAGYISRHRGRLNPEQERWRQRRQH